MTDKTLETYLSDCQTTALAAENILCALLAIVGDPKHDQLAYTLVDGAHDLIKELNLRLDSANVPKGGVA